MAIPDPIAAVVTMLAADATVASLAGSRVYGAELLRSETTNQPRYAVVVKPVPVTNLPSGYAAWSTIGVETLCYGATPQQAGALRLAVYDALKNLKRKVHEEVLLHWANPLGVIAFRDPETDWPVQAQTFQVLASEIAIT